MMLLVAGKYVVLLMGVGLLVRALSERSVAGQSGAEGCHD
jgi:hypothetical protein